MIVRDEEFDRLMSNGADFEKVMESLIRAEAWACGIAPTLIDWDYRTNVPDGGRDVMVRSGNQRTDRQFLPPDASVWSLKSGQDGLRPATLRNEIERHPDVIAHLQAGGAYVWCVAAAANPNRRERLRNAVGPLAERYQFRAAQIYFCFQDTIREWFNLHIGLISIYFPHLPRGWKTFKEWRRLDRNARVPWVKFGDRERLVRGIRRHLLTTSDNNVIHFAGLSGIGKTRTVRRACQHGMLEGVLYFPTLQAFTSDFEDYLTRNGGIRAAIVIDEVEIEDFVPLQTRLSAFRDRIRIVTIGAGTTKSVMFREGVISVSLPDSTADVTQVIRAADSGLSAEQAQNIADWCDHDLSLALLLTESNRQDPGLSVRPITSVDDVWNRVIRLFESEIGNAETFRNLYEMLSLCLDIGNAGGKRHELEHLAAYFGKPVPELDQAITRACAVGLGRLQGRFFEATPRAFARRIFERWGWERIRNDALRFFSGMPTERLQRRFIERIQECDQHTREEAAAVLNDWLRGRFPVPDITMVSEREPSRVFAEYAETNPVGGLQWLGQAVELASPDQLLAFEGGWGPDGWRGRRQIVRLCQDLAQYQEYFWQCEAILFRLAQYETENLANNSLKAWQGLFLPFFSNTPLPFDTRWQLLMRRLSQSTDEQLLLIMTAAVKALSQSVTDWLTGNSLPETVGGRPVPRMWWPANDGEIYRMASTAAAQVIEMVKEMPLDHRKCSQTVIVDDISTFIRLGTLETLRDWLAPGNMTAEELEQLKLRLDQYIYWLNLRVEDHPQFDIYPQEEKKAWARRALDHVLPWRRSLNPQTLSERIIEITGRSSWEQMNGGLMNSLSADRVYQDLAGDTLVVPGELRGLWDWFNSDRALSAFEFGLALGNLDTNYSIEADLLGQLTQGRCVKLVTGYFESRFRRQSAAPEALVDALDRMVDDYPEAVIQVTLRADISDAGFQRLLLSVPRAQSGAYSWLQRLQVTQDWPRLMTAERQAQILVLLAEVGQSGQPKAYDLALELVCQWTPLHTRFSAVVADAVLPVLTRSLEQPEVPDRGWHWMIAVGRLPESHLVHKINLLVEAVKTHINLRSDARSMLSEILRVYPVEATPILETKILDLDREDRRLIGDLLSLLAGQLETIQRLVRELGVVGARALAEHLIAPYPKAEDPIYVPPLTAWLLDEFADDDYTFGLYCAALHSRQVYVGGMARYFIGTEEKVAPYLNHHLRRIREWAQNEIDHARFMIEWDNQLESERDRT